MFAASLAVTRVVLALAHAGNERLDGLLRERIARACLISAGLFALSIVVPEPFRYVLWAPAALAASTVHQMACSP